MSLIDITFNVFSDTPKGKDPDSYSPTLRHYHQILWGKPLPCGLLFTLDLDTPRLLHHKSELGEFILSSDAIGHTYKDVKKMAHIVDQLPDGELDAFFHTCTTIGGFILFPANRIDKKLTINGARGFSQKIADRIDLTLECIRRFYLKDNSPLSEVFERYADFFALFESFKGYVDFFLLQDLVTEDYMRIKFCHPFNGFEFSPNPKNMEEYLVFKANMLNFIDGRNDRISNFGDSLTTYERLRDENNQALLRV